jgi:hypothetical protein
VRGRILQALAGVAISALALWFTLRGKPLGPVWEAMRQVDWRFLLLYVPFWAALHFARTWRWGLLLEPVAKVPFAKLNAVSCVGWMALVLLPFRLGEFARPYLVAERPRLRVSAALSSVVVERVTDGLFTALVLMACLLAVPSTAPGVHLVRTAGVVMAAVFVGALVFLLIGFWNGALAARLLGRIVGPISPRVAEKAMGMVEAFVQGLRRVPSRGKVLLIAVLTCVYWGVNAWGMQVFAQGFGLHLDALQATTLLGILVIGVMIPAGPGMVGTFQASILAALGLFLPRAVVEREGMAYANVLWGAQMLLQIVPGLVFLFSRHIRIANVLAAPEEVAEELEEEAGEAVAPAPGGPAAPLDRA